jgi:predicted RNase H-like HicB family nuclease
MNYLVIFERSSTGWGAYVPDLPGCVATGATRAEVERLIQEGIAFHIEGIRLNGETVPEPSSEAALISVPA